MHRRVVVWLACFAGLLTSVLLNTKTRCKLLLGVCVDVRAPVFPGVGEGGGGVL